MKNKVFNQEELCLAYGALFGNGKIAQCWPAGKNAIRIARGNGNQEIFTMYDKERWKLESIDMFIDAITGGRNDD